MRITARSSVLARSAFRIPSAAPRTRLRSGWNPAASANSNTILAVYSAHHPLQFSLHQSNSDLAIEYRRPGRQHRRRAYVDRVFEQDQPVFITLVSGEQGLAAYVNGLLTRTFPGFLPSGNGPAGRLVMGTSPQQEDCWSGQVRGLALYRTELTAQRALEHYQTWTYSKRPALEQADRAIAVYLFDEHSGNVVHNQIGSGTNLYIPQRFMLLHQRLLVPPWKEYYPGPGYWKDVLVNIGGFVPLGFIFCAYWALTCSTKWAALAAILLGVALTLMIEILQAYLPTRQSGVTDLFTNTFGACLGAGLYCWPPARRLFTGTLRAVLPLERTRAMLSRRVWTSS